MANPSRAAARRLRRVLAPHVVSDRPDNKFDGQADVYLDGDTMMGQPRDWRKALGPTC